MTTKPQDLVIVRDGDLMDAVRKMDTELKTLVDQLQQMNERMAADNEALRQRLGLPEPKAVQHG